MATLPKRIGKFDIRSQLGAGAMATVYQAYDPVIERTLAIKVVDKARLDESESENILQRFRVEARAAGRLQHQNIVAVYDFGEEGDLVYLALIPASAGLVAGQRDLFALRATPAQAALTAWISWLAAAWPSP